MLTLVEANPNSRQYFRLYGMYFIIDIFIIDIFAGANFRRFTFQPSGRNFRGFNFCAYRLARPHPLPDASARTHVILVLTNAQASSTRPVTV